MDEIKSGIELYITGGYVLTEEELIEHIRRKILGGRELIYIGEV